MNVDASQLVDSSSSLQYFFRTYWLEGTPSLTRILNSLFSMTVVYYCVTVLERGHGYWEL
jgi:hypothetical protein